MRKIIWKISLPIYISIQINNNQTGIGRIVGRIKDYFEKKGSCMVVYNVGDVDDGADKIL